MSLSMTGELEKLIITAYADEDFSRESAKYQAMVNPETVREQYQVNFDQKQAIGSSSATLRFKGIQSPTLNLQLLFDATGAIDGMKTPIADQIGQFTKVALNYDGNIHRTPYLKLAWGSMLFKGVLISMDLEYKLFRQDGTPVQALAYCSFQSTTTEETRAKKENNNSPDMTHIRTVVEGDTLTQMVYKIYGDIKYYPQIVKVNNLKSFRNLSPGDQIVFPPIDNSTQ